MSDLIKPQSIRIIDVLLLGPFMIYAAMRLEGWTRAGLGFVGAATIVYNLRNYWIIRAREDAKLV
jgi:hypothetical protein